MKGMRVSLPMLPIIISMILSFIQLCVAIFFLSIWMSVLLVVLGVLKLLCIIFAFGHSRLSNRE